ncbi:MAG: hypothetical protein ACF8TS_18845 [Maioricimonas sp. JB049]
MIVAVSCVSLMRTFPQGIAARCATDPARGSSSAVAGATVLDWMTAISSTTITNAFLKAWQIVLTWEICIDFTNRTTMGKVTTPLAAVSLRSGGNAAGYQRPPVAARQ